MSSKRSRWNEDLIDVPHHPEPVDGHEEDDQVGAAHENLPEWGHDGPDVNGQGSTRRPDVGLCKIVAFGHDVRILEKNFLNFVKLNLVMVVYHSDPPANRANERRKICVVSRGGNFFNSVCHK